MLVTVSINRIWSVRVWDLERGVELATGGLFRLNHGQEDKTMAGLAVDVSRNELRIIFASKYGKVMIGNYEGSSPMGQYPY